jgi:hypothetical protein
MKSAKLSIVSLCSLAWLFSTALMAAERVEPHGNLPIFDAHIHYSHDVWDTLPPKEAIQRLRDIGITRAMVSSTSDEGTQRLYQADPDFVIPVLRPYRKRGTLKTWMYDESIIPYLKERLANFRYVAIGEFHIDGEQAKLPVIREIIHLANTHQLILHVHSDAKAIEYIFEQDPDAHILWAHAGFEYAYIVKELMDKHATLWADLSFRREIFNNGRFLPDWQPLLNGHADRFLLGIDTYEPDRWLRINSVMQWQRQLLAALPKDVAKKIAYENGARLTDGFSKRQAASK